MISEEILNKPLMMMTGREFLELNNIIIEQQPKIMDFSEREFIYGLDGIASLMNCGKTKAQQVKNSGILNEAIIQNGKKIIVDKELALELLKKVSII